ncbi:MAG: hypothetical protein AAGI09_13495 [Pseudomonadota bacterium]
MAEPKEPPQTVRLYTKTEDGSTVVLEAPRVRAYYRERFLTMFMNTSRLLATMDRPQVYYRALFHLLSVLDPIQMRRYSARELAQATGMSQVSAERAMAMLEADRVLMRTGKGTAKALRINNNLAWASTAEKHNLTEVDPEIIDARGRA